MKVNRLKFALLGLMLALAGGWLAPRESLAATTYSMKVVASMPKGSAGEKPASTLPTNTKISPCNDATKVDWVAFTVTYNAGTVADKDVYFILYNPESTSKYYAILKPKMTSPTLVNVRATLAALDATNDIYVARGNNPGGSQTEIILGSFIPVDGVDTGTWQLVGIVADSTTVDFDDITTWSAWDVATVIFNKPWKGTTLAICQ
jgi:hypothetical protein